MERLLGSFLLLFGVAITSYIMEHLTKMIMAIRELKKMHEEEDQLSVFLGTLERFNGEVKIELETVKKIEDYFQYRWIKNKNHAISTAEDYNLLL